MNLTVTVDLTWQSLAADGFLAVSLGSLIWQAWSHRLLHRFGASRGLARTVACRVGCAVLYVLVGLNAIVGHYAPLAVSLAAYSITQLTWITNSWLDIRQTRGRQKPYGRCDARQSDAQPRPDPGAAARRWS